MDVNGPAPVQSTFPIKQVSPAQDVPQAAQTGPPASCDEVEISTAGKLLDKISQAPEMRAERLAEIKAAIEAGEYETPAKLEAALEKLPVSTMRT